MKNKILLISIVFAQSVLAQDRNQISESLQRLNNDTVRYIKEFIVSRKSIYIGKPLDSLLKDLPMILRYDNGDIPSNRSLCPTTTLCWSSYKQTLDKLANRKNPLIVTITWASPLDNNELQGRGLKLWGDVWTINAYNYYKDKIIGNIETFKDDQ